MINNGRGKRSTVIVIVILALLLSGVYAETRHSFFSEALNMSQKRLVPEGITFEYTSDASPEFSGGKDGFLCATKDGAIFYSFKGSTLWSETFSMQSPRIIKSASGWAVLEPRGRLVYVFGPKGLIYSVALEYPILSADLNNINCLSVILETSEGYEIRVYNSLGQFAFERKSELTGVYPISVAVSGDGYTYCVSYLDTTKSTLSSRILYFYTNSGAKRYGADFQNPYKAIEMHNSVVTGIFYGANGNLVCVSDNKIFITTSRGEEVFTYDLLYQINSYSYNDKKFGIAFGKPLMNAPENDEKKAAVWYDFNGKLISDYLIEEVSQIDVFDRGVLIKSDDLYIYTDENGKEIWTYRAPDDVLVIIPDGKKRAVIAKRGVAEVHSLKMPKREG